jgi:Ribonuclease G/E
MARCERCKWTGDLHGWVQYGRDESTFAPCPDCNGTGIVDELDTMPVEAVTEKKAGE